MERLYGEDYEGLVTLLHQFAAVLRATDREEQGKTVFDRARRLAGEPDLPDAAEMLARSSALASRDRLTAPPDTVSFDLVSGRIYREDDEENGQSFFLMSPRLINCPRYDPKVRTAKYRIDARYERRIELERMPLAVEAYLEVVVGIDGRINQTLSRVERTTDNRVNKMIL